MHSPFQAQMGHKLCSPGHLWSGYCSVSFPSYVSLTSPVSRTPATPRSWCRLVILSLPSVLITSVFESLYLCLSIIELWCISLVMDFTEKMVSGCLTGSPREAGMFCVFLIYPLGSCWSVEFLAQEVVIYEQMF